MATVQLPHRLSQTVQEMPLAQSIDVHLAKKPETPETHRPLQRLGNFFLIVLDRYIELVGLDASEAQAPPLFWTPYSDNRRAAMRSSGILYR